MTTDRDFERRIADHYAAQAPANAPRWVLERALASVEATPQRRSVLGRPWSITIRPSALASLGMVAAAIAAISLVGLVLMRPSVIGPAASASPSPSPSVRPSPSTGYSRFDSPINGMSIDVPSGWQANPATESWTGGPLNFDSPAADVIFDPATRDRAYLLLASKPLDSLSGNWQHEVIAWLCNGSGGEMWSIPGGIDGVRAEAHRCGQDETAIFIETTTRGYFVRPVVSSDDPVLAARYDWVWVESLLRTLDLRPGDAVTPSASPARTAPASGGITRLDGEVLRFTGDRSPWVGDLVAVHPETGATRVLIKDLKALDSARWSADGRWIAYDDGALWVVGSDDRPRQLTVGATGWAWSGDGARLAIVGDRDVSIYDAATGQTVEIGEVEGPPTWSPDGTRFVFGEQGGSIYSVDVRTGERRLLVRLPGDNLDSVDRIEWSPDGSRLAIVNDLEPGLFRLFMLNADGSDIRVVAEDVNVSGLAWSPDGTRIAFAESSDPELRIWVAHADGSAPALIGVRPNQDDGGDPVWSPDASQVAFWTEPDTAFVTAADGSGGVTALPARTYEDWRGGWYACGWCAAFGFQAF
jgi:Tol biopolymer transport system component